MFCQSLSVCLSDYLTVCRTVVLSVGLYVSKITQNVKTDLAEIFRECRECQKLQVIQFWGDSEGILGNPESGRNPGKITQKVILLELSGNVGNTKNYK